MIGEVKEIPEDLKLVLSDFPKIDRVAKLFKENGDAYMLADVLEACGISLPTLRQYAYRFRLLRDCDVRLGRVCDLRIDNAGIIRRIA